ncbi:MAG: hypothetical protein MUP17_12975 [candidate division Zixibacteria bacterium]|nr:hypothetical protein [candidate division Zixibacteria bacterium]
MYFVQVLRSNREKYLARNANHLKKEKKMKPKVIFFVAVFVFLFSFSYVLAEVPKMINYQGKITRPSGALIDTTTSMVFSIYAESTDGTALWTETQPSVKVEFGVFSVLLGSVNPIPATVFDGNTRYLGLKVGSDNEMTPRKAIVSVGYAYHSTTADTAHFAMPDSDWTINGDNVYHLNGNVGIGTMTPGAKLDVNGYARFNSTDLYGYQQYAYQALNVGGSQSELRWIKIPNANTSPLRFSIFRYTHEDGSWLGQLSATVSTNIGEWGSQAGNTFIRVEKAEFNVPLLKSVVSCEGSGGGQSGIFLQVLGGRTYHFSGLPSVPILSDPECSQGSTTLNLGYGSGVWIAPALIVDGNIYGNLVGTIDNADKLDGFHNGQVSADIWDGHDWGDTYPGASNSDLVDGIHGTQFLRNDQSGTLNGSLTMGGDINLGSNRLNMTGERWLRPNFESDEIFLNTDLNTGIIFRFSDPYRKIRFSHDGTNGYITSYGSGGLVLQSSTNGITLDAANNVIAAERINPRVNNAFPLGGASERWADGWFVNLHYSGTLYPSHLAESKLPLNNTEIEDGDVIVYNPETGKWEKCNSEKTLDFVSVAVKSTAEEMKVDPENVEGFEGRPVILGVYHVKVIGKVKKGQILVTSSVLGYAKAVDATVQNLPYRIGRPVELKDTDGPGTIKAYFNIK